MTATLDQVSGGDAGANVASGAWPGGCDPDARREPATERLGGVEGLRDDAVPGPPVIAAGLPARGVGFLVGQPGSTLGSGHRGDALPLGKEAGGENVFTAPVGSGALTGSC